MDIVRKDNMDSGNGAEVDGELLQENNVHFLHVNGVKKPVPYFHILESRHDKELILGQASDSE